MTPEEIELYSRANDIVGILGEPTDKNTSVTNECYQEFVYKFTDHKIMKAVFLKWVESYTYYEKHREFMLRDTPLVIYWRIKPSIEKEEDGTYLYTRLLISNKTQGNLGGIFHAKKESNAHQEVS